MITGVILARNEASNIVDCLQAIRPHVDELILIDMESEDDTVALAHPFVSKVLSHPRIANFDVARNIAIDEASHDWLWFVDADERIPARLGEIVRGIVKDQSDQCEAIVLPFKNFFSGKWIQHCGWWPGYTMPRVLKRGRFQFNEQLHSGVSVNGRQIFLPPDPSIAVEHLSYQSIEHYVEKFNRYTSTEADNLRRQGKPFDWREGIRSMVRDLWWYYEHNHGHRDGAHGWVLSWLAGQYRWFSQAKLLGSTDSPLGVHSVPESLDVVVSAIEEDLAHCRKDNPRLPLGVLLRAPIRDISGYGCECRDVVYALSGLGRDLSVHDTQAPSIADGLSPAEDALLNVLAHKRPPANRLTITAGIPPMVQPDPSATVNVLRTTFETDRIPSFWIPHLEQFDEIWVWSHANERAFRRGGIAPEKLRIVPGCIDTTKYCPSGSKKSLPSSMRNRFVFLSIFDWHLRKGWDVLLRAYCQEFREDENVGLYLKITLNHVNGIESVIKQADSVLSELGTSLQQRPDIVISSDRLNESDLASLYRSVDAFVVASRGEGWGRPFLEAMASGLPTIGTSPSGNSDFMNDANSLLVSATWQNVSEEAAREIPVFSGHSWLEPDLESLRQKMRFAASNRKAAIRIAKQATSDVRNSFNIEIVRNHLRAAIESLESRFKQIDLPARRVGQLTVELEGEFLASHSFSNINEVICNYFASDPNINLVVNRRMMCPTRPARSSVEHRIEQLSKAAKSQPADICIRHAFPPNWERPDARKWVHIQPWEFGSLPISWAKPLAEQVDEIWAPSNYVQKVYERSGVPKDKVYVIPWGIDPLIFSPETPDLILPTEKTFRFLFVGGAIQRKGFDLLLEAYLSEFGPEEDVCLVVKNMGNRTVYLNQTYENQIKAAMIDPTNPSLVYLDSFLSDGQLASLYVACQCFVSPYRGEGFALPVLEAMACGLAPIVPKGGPTDDFVSDETGYLLPSEFVECDHPFRLKGIATELSVSIDDLRTVMRSAFENRGETARRGRQASDHVREKFTWQASVNRMKDRIYALASSNDSSKTESNPERSRKELIRDIASSNKDGISLCMIVRDNEKTIEDALLSIRPWVDEMIVVDTGSVDATPEICRRLGAKVYNFRWCDDFSAARNESLKYACREWIFWMDSDDVISELNGKKLRELIDVPPSPSLAGFVVQVHCPNFRANGGRDLTVVDHVKLFRNREHLRFEGRIHEQILTSIRAYQGEVAWSDVFVTHAGSDQTDEGRTKKVERDLRILKKDLDDRPEHPFVLFNLGMTYADVREHELAIEFLLRSIASSEPDHSHVRKAYGLLVSAMMASEKFDDAWQACANGRRIFPKDPELHFREGMLHHHFGRLIQAEQSYLQALSDCEERHFTSIDPGIVGSKARHNLARVYEDMGDFEHAINQWTLIIDEIPGYRSGWQAIADLLVKTKQFSDLENLLHRLKEVAVNIASLHPEVALIELKHLLYRNDTAKTLQYARQSLKLFPSDTPLLTIAAQILFEHGDLDECIPILRDLVSSNSEDGAAYHNLGVAYLRLNQPDEAIIHLRQSLLVRPRTPHTSLQLGHALLAIGRLEEAVVVWKHALRESPGDPALAAAIRLRTHVNA